MATKLEMIESVRARRFAETLEVECIDGYYKVWDLGSYDILDLINENRDYIPAADFIYLIRLVANKTAYLMREITEQQYIDFLLNQNNGMPNPHKYLVSKLCLS